MKRIAIILMVMLLVGGSCASNVRAQNAAPVANAGLDMVVLPGTFHNLDGFYSNDPGDGVASYAWQQTSGPAVTLSNPTAMNPVFQAPSSPTTLTFQLTVTDKGGLKSSDTCTVEVLAPGGTAPTDTTPPMATLTAPTGGVTVSGSITLSATATDNVGVTKVEFYAGSTLLGTGTNSSGTTWQFSWNTSTVPNGSYSLTAKAYDAANYSGVSSARSFTVRNTTPPPVNKAPVANAGPDQTVRSGATVRLSGAGSSDPDNGIASYLWQQTSGTSVRLSGTNSVNASFVAPRVSSGSVTLNFRLTVKDKAGLSSSDTVRIIVNRTAGQPDD
jgi:large repetitive protein